MIIRKDLSPIYEMISQQTSVPVDLVKQIVNYQFAYLKDNFILNLNEQQPGMLMHSLGTFIYKKSALNTLILRDILPELRKAKAESDDELYAQLLPCHV